MNTFWINTQRSVPAKYLRNNATTADVDKALKQGIWVYFLLLIFEGALRKWLLPFLSTPLLIVRDPLAIWLLCTAWKRGFFPWNGWVITLFCVSVISIYTAVLFGHGNLFVALYGSRIMFIHFPVIFIIGHFFTKDDVIRMGIVILKMSICMTLLIAIQFYSPQTALVNRGLGGDMEGIGFGEVMDFFRPSGTFSFTNGVSLFYGLSSCFVFYFWFNTSKINFTILVASTIGLLAAIPLSISRGLFFQTGVAILFTLVAVLRRPEYFNKIILIAVAAFIVASALSLTSFFKTATTVFEYRFTSANEEEGGVDGILVTRYFGEMIRPITRSLSQPLFGYGLGLGTNVGSMLIAGDRLYLVAEGEWERTFGELGPILGLMVVLVRVSLAASIAFRSYKKLSDGDLLPWLLLSFGLLTIPQAQWAQPTSLGFCILIAGLSLASLNEKETTDKKIRLAKQKFHLQFRYN
ncbi:MAG: hypothetical protein ACTHJ5_03945 [Ilyomonas sp.]